MHSWLVRCEMVEHGLARMGPSSRLLWDDEAVQISDQTEVSPDATFESPAYVARLIPSSITPRRGKTSKEILL
jgi:hypothetical protein